MLINKGGGGGNEVYLYNKEDAPEWGVHLIYITHGGFQPVSDIDTLVYSMLW